ncbi:hypothetical protein HYH02_007861 [Chlamydomonas schloesseri]|uniref:Uncharacterized protein n=1 Tax=Chlamydomonas schloesseri TaxID=2026947 RepID=A0A836B4K6_9CHLO|nr:hypothetical protein HYH02_007861 [Chlamydomonas schloesseri]|eukprot:KAG2447114.1 hypothetical protein HYH02_007861 [Chlamydomonas schloesseri]
MANVPIVAASAAALTASLAGLAGLAQSIAGRREAGARARPGLRAPAAAAEDFEDDNVNLAESASVWLARRGSSQVLEPPSSSYGELELLADGEFVYFRKDTEVLTTIPHCKVLQLQPLQLAKGRSDAVPTAPLEPNSVWLVLRKKQEVVFMLLGSDHQRHVLEADPQSPLGVTLGGGAVKRRGRWTITPQGLASLAWPEHLLPLQVLTVQLVDARAVGSVKAAMARKLNELANILDGEAHHRAMAETRSQQLELELRRVKDEVASQVAELRAQLDAAVRGRHVAEREVASLQGQKADEAVRAKMAQARAAQAEFDAQQAAATVKGLQQQIQGMLAGHAEELRTLQNELQIAREANDGLKRAMGEQVMALQGALELRDARILELEEENERMDTVLQVIQAQLGQGGGSAVEGLSAAVEQARAAPEAGDSRGAAAQGGVGPSTCEGSEPSTCEPSKPEEEAQPEQPPLWKALLDSTGDISLTALKESLEVSRRNNPEEPRHANPPGSSDAAPEPGTQPASVEERAALESTEPSTGPTVPEPAAATNDRADAQADGSEPAGPRAWPFTLSPDRSFSLTDGGEGGKARSGLASSGGEWGSGGGALGEEEPEFVSAAARMSGSWRAGGSGASSSGGGGSGGGSASTAVRAAAHAMQPTAAGMGGGARELLCGAAGGKAADGMTKRSDLPSGSAIQAAASASSSSSPTRHLQRQHSAAELEFGGAAVVTLDSLRRRMRALAAEYDRCAVLSQSLRESLPWRTADAAAAAANGGAGVLAAAAAAASGAGLEPVAEAAVEAPSTDSGRSRSSAGGVGSRRSAAREEVTSPTLAASSGRASWQASETPQELLEDGSGRKRPRQSFGSRLEGVMSGGGAGALAAASLSMEAAARPGRSSAAAVPQREGGTNGVAASTPPALGVGTVAPGVRATGSNVQRITQKLLAAGAGGSASAGEPNMNSIAAPRGPRLGSHALLVTDSLTSSTATLAGSPHSRSGAGGGDTDRSASASVSVSAMQQLATPFASASAPPAPGQALVPLRASSRSGSGSGAAGQEPGAEADATASPPGFTVHYTPWSASVSEEAQMPVPVGSEGSDDGREAEGATSSVRCNLSSSLGAGPTSRRGSASSSGSQQGSPGPESDSLSPLPADEPSGLRGQADAAVPPTDGPGGGPLKPAFANGPGSGGIGRFVPELKLEGTRADTGMYESIDGMCCLGSTRAFPTARNAAGALTARQVSHSRQASFGAHAAFAVAHDQLTPPVLSPAGAAAGPSTAAAAEADTFARTPLGEDAQSRGAAGAGAGGGAAAATAGTTPKGASTPPSGAALDDDAMHCDDQEPSPPPPGGMLLGTLEQLRGGGGPGTTGKRAALAALEEDDEEEGL